MVLLILALMAIPTVLKALLDDSIISHILLGVLWGCIMLVVLFLLPSCSSAPVSNRETYINARQFLPNGTEPLLPPGSRLNKELNLNINTDIFKYGYWDNRVWSIADQSQFRTIGWNYKLGVRATQNISLEYEHFSKHLLDSSWPTHFPVQDSVGINFYFNRRDAVESIIK